MSSNVDTAKAELAARGAAGPCHRCGHPEIQFVGFSHVPIKPMGSPEMVNIPIAGAAVTACSNCGAFNLHSTVTLGLEGTRGA